MTDTRSHRQCNSIVFGDFKFGELSANSPIHQIKTIAKFFHYTVCSNFCSVLIYINAMIDASIHPSMISELACFDVDDEEIGSR